MSWARTNLLTLTWEKVAVGHDLSEIISREYSCVFLEIEEFCGTHVETVGTVISNAAADYMLPNPVPPLHQKRTNS